MIKRNTNKIINEIKNKKSHNIDRNKFLNNDFHTFINEKIKEKKLKKIDLLKRANLDEKNGYKYLNGTKKVKRDVALKMLIILENDFDQIQSILKKYQYPVLYPKYKRDYIIISSIFKKYDVNKTNEELKKAMNFYYKI